MTETTKPIMVKDYHAKCCGTCANGIWRDYTCLECDISGESVSPYCVCNNNYVVEPIK